MRPARQGNPTAARARSQKTQATSAHPHARWREGPQAMAADHCVFIGKEEVGVEAFKVLEAPKASAGICAAWLEWPQENRAGGSQRSLADCYSMWASARCPLQRCRDRPLRPQRSGSVPHQRQRDGMPETSRSDALSIDMNMHRAALVRWA